MGSTQPERVVNNLTIAFMAVVVGIFVVSRLRQAAQTADAPTQPIDDASLEEVRAQLRAGQKLNAIKTYKKATGASLRAAKDAIEAMDVRHTPTPSRGFDVAAHAAVRDALLAGNKLQAIKVYRETTGVGLKEAKDAVEAMAVNEGIRL